jgi:hypothetical protein
MKISRWFILLLSLWLAGGRFALAHPVAQGALDVQILPDRIDVQLRVSGEEVLVADTFAASDKPNASTLAEVWQRHGQYLLQHI